jgi:hypothetical protein
MGKGLGGKITVPIRIYTVVVVVAKALNLKRLMLSFSK